MKVNIGPYKSWFGPYQLAEALCFWARPVVDEDGFPSKPDWVHDFGEWLAHGSVEPELKPGESRSIRRERKNTLLYRFLLWLDGKKKRKIRVKIHDYDVWSMDDTLAHIILPMLKRLKEKKHGAPYVDDSDVPEHLRSTTASPKQNKWDTDDNHFARWDWVIDEMIFAFDSKVDTSWESQFVSGEADWVFVKEENGLSRITKGPADTYQFDTEGRKAYEARIQNGFSLFGKYYQALWD